MIDVKKLAAAHWDYVKQVILLHENMDAEIDITQVVEMIGYHYQTAMIHGFKHGFEMPRMSAKRLRGDQVEFESNECHEVSGEYAKTIMG